MVTKCWNITPWSFIAPCNGYKVLKHNMLPIRTPRGEPLFYECTGFFYTIIVHTGSPSLICVFFYHCLVSQLSPVVTCKPSSYMYVLPATGMWYKFLRHKFVNNNSQQLNLVQLLPNIRCQKICFALAFAGSTCMNRAYHSLYRLWSDVNNDPL